jgi:hypothetical protein
MTQPIKTSLLLLIFATLIGTSACKKNESTGYHESTGKSVYVLGNTHDGSFYWKDSIPTKLPGDPKSPSLLYFPVSMAVANGHVYVCGTAMTFNGTADVYFPCYWVDGKLYNLPDTTHLCSATGIFVSGNDIYVSGFDHGSWPGGYVFYWKNGVKTTVTQPFEYDQYSSGIFVSNNNVYVVGGSYAINYQEPNTYHYGEYWKNGVGYSLDSSVVDSAHFKATLFPQMDGIFVNGNDVYCSGFIDSIITPYQNIATQAAYWKNGSVVRLSGPGSTEATSVFFANDTAYIAGEAALVNGQGNAVLWKNSAQNMITLSSNVSSAYSVNVSGKDVYVSGAETVNGVSYVTYWKNGVANHITAGYEGLSIVVQ